jgi:hypothetical protein
MQSISNRLKRTSESLAPLQTKQEKRTQSWQRLAEALPRLLGVDNRGQVVHCHETAMARESCYVALQSHPKGQADGCVCKVCQDAIHNMCPLLSLMS